MWLRKNSTDFRNVMELAEKRWGKQIIHKNLLVAQVKDIGIKLQVEKLFADSHKVNVVFLPDDYIAFPHDHLIAIQKLVETSGHVIKRKKTEQAERMDGMK